jgi:hypothetical protein
MSLNPVARDRRIYDELVNSQEWQTYSSQGRITPPPHNNAVENLIDAKAQLARLKQEDKTITRYYELATGQTADTEVTGQFAKYADDPAMLQAAINQYAAKAPSRGEFNDAINSTIKEKLGRDATDAEKQYFGKQMEQGGVDLYGLNTFLEGTTEYQTKSSDVARGKLATELGGVDQAYLDKVSKQLQAQYSAQGRQGAGAFGSALIGAGKDIATQRTGYLSQLGYGDFQRGQQNLRSDYEAQLARQYAGQQQGAALGQESRARYYGQQDFDRQQAAQERMMRLQQPKSGSFLQNVVPGIFGAATQLGAAYLGRPQTSNYNMGGTPYNNYVMQRPY